MFTCDETKKKEVLKKYKFKNKLVYYSFQFTPILIFIVGIGVLLFGIISDRAFLVTDPGKASFGEKDYFSLGLAVTLIVLTLIILFKLL